MTQELPADIAEAIDGLQFAYEAVGQDTVLHEARKALEAAILRHLGGGEKPRASVSKVKLSAGQHDVLRHLVRRSPHDGAPSGPDISRALRHRYDDWAYGKLVALEKRGLVERLGSTFSGGQCWGATDQGRSALAEDGRDK